MEEICVCLFFVFALFCLSLPQLYLPGDKSSLCYRPGRTQSPARILFLKEFSSELPFANT